MTTKVCSVVFGRRRQIEYIMTLIFVRLAEKRFVKFYLGLIKALTGLKRFFSKLLIKVGVVEGNLFTDRKDN